MMARVKRLSSIKVYPNEEYDRHTEEELSSTFVDKASVTVKVGNQEYTFENCRVDLYSPVDKTYDVVGYHCIDVNKLKAENGGHIYTIDMEK